MKWEQEKEELERLINLEHVSYEEIGRRYGVSGASIKGAAKRLGINLSERRKINPNEHFNKGTAKTGKCLNCGKEIVLYESSCGKFCSNKCQAEFKKNSIIEDWKSGNYKGNSECISKTIRDYLLEKNEYKCESCGFEGYNKLTGKTILQIHHKDGDSSNNSEENLQVLCPNCHSMTETYSNCGKRKSSRTRYDSKEYYFGKFKKEFGIN